MFTLLAEAEKEAEKKGFTTGLEETAKVAFGKAPTATVEVVAGEIIRTVLIVVGLLFLILMIYGGVTWMLGGREGKENEIDKAKKILEAAVVGLVIVSAGYAITNFVITNIDTATR